MLKTTESYDTGLTQSAFHPVGSGSKSPVDIGVRRSAHRDSGYGSDFSPAGVKTATRRFTFDDRDGVRSELSNRFDDLDLSSDEEVFIDSDISAISEPDDDDEADREVENLLRHCHSDETSCETNVIIRPVAPLPTAGSESRNERDLCLIASPYYHTKWRARDSLTGRCSFRPIVSRSIGTQTPNPHCLLMQEAFNSNMLTRHNDAMHSGHEFPLPDVIPGTRDRSVSLPDVQTLRRREHEMHVGQELRRISDDFNTIYLKRRGHRARTRSVDPSAMSRFGVDLPGYWNSLRRFLSTSPLFQLYNRDKH